MIVYVYDKKTNVKRQTFKNVCAICSFPDRFILTMDGCAACIMKDENVKLVSYGFC